MEIPITYLIIALIGLLLYGWFLRIVFDVSTFRENQKQIAKTLTMILEELRNDKLEFPATKPVRSSDDPYKNAAIAGKISDLKRRFKEGEISKTEYIRQMNDLA